MRERDTRSEILSIKRIRYAPVGTLRENGFESVGTGALDHVDERPGVENDLLEWGSSGGASHSDFRSGGQSRR